MMGKSAVKVIVFAFIFLIASTTTVFVDSSDAKNGYKSQGINHTNSFGKKIKTTRDDKGVWFITGGRGVSRYYVFEAMGYAVATDRLWQMELYKRQSLGRLSEIFGAGQLGTDIYLRTIGYSEEELTEGVKNLNPKTLKVVKGYVAGINRRILEINNNPSLLPAEFQALSLTTVEIWRCQDVLAWIAMLQKNFDPEALDTTQLGNAALLQQLTGAYGQLSGYEMFNDLRWTNDPEAQTYIVDENEAQQISSTPGKSSGKAKTLPSYDAETIANTANKLKKKREKVVKKLKDINAFVKMGSYAWVVSGDKTESGNPIIYSGPQMGFSVPSIVTEGSIRAGGLDVSGMTIPGIPGIIIGRTPHHAWSMQVGHAHTTDYYFEAPEDVFHHRTEIIKVFGGDDISLPVFRTARGPVVSPMPYDPSSEPIVSWKYSHWGYEFNTIEAFLDLAEAKSMNEFGQGIEKIGVSQHFCYADKDGNIAYWMSGRNPLRPDGEWRLPQGTLGLPLEWDSSLLSERSTARNPGRGYFGGWNNKTNPDYDNSYNSLSDIYGPFHRAHVIYDYFDTAFEENRLLSFEDVKDLALNIAATDSFGGGGNPWKFVESYFRDAVISANTVEYISTRQDALDLLSDWDGHFVAGGESMWATGTDRADAWVLMDAWIDQVLKLTFDDELGEDTQSKRVLFNVLLHGFAGSESGVVNNYDWFANSDPNAPNMAEQIIVTALDTVLIQLGSTPWGENARGAITYNHAMFGTIHSHPFSSRSTYAHCVEYGANGPVRIESMFPLGQSGNILFDSTWNLDFDDNFLSMTPVFDNFVYREFPLFDKK